MVAGYGKSSSSASNAAVVCAEAVFLEPYGYSVTSRDSWKEVPRAGGNSPSLALALAGHAEVGGHTLYHVDCSLKSLDGLSLSWQTPRRLSHLRQALHSNVARILGERYARHFCDTPFAARGGLVGTTGRLAKWLDRLAVCINHGWAPPELVHFVLHFFEVPPIKSAGCASGCELSTETLEYHERIQQLFLEEACKHFEYEAAERCLGLKRRGVAGVALLQEILRCFVENIEDLNARTDARDCVWDPETRRLVPLDDAHRQRYYDHLLECMEPALIRALSDASIAASKRRGSALDLLQEREAKLRGECFDLLDQKTGVTEALQERLENPIETEEALSPTLTCSPVSRRFLREPGSRRAERRNSPCKLQIATGLQ